MKPAVVTFSTHKEHTGIDRLKASMLRNGWPEDSFRLLVGKWTGWVGRLRAVLAQADPLRFLGFTHLIHVDAFDVICLGRPEELEPALADAGNPAMLMAAESACWPDSHRAAEYPPRELPWHFCHSQYVLDLNQRPPFGLGVDLDHEDDQRHLTNLYLAGTPGIVLDTKCRVIQSIAHNHPWYNFYDIREDKRVVNKVTKTAPIFFHGNGKTDGSWIPGWVSTQVA